MLCNGRLLICKLCFNNFEIKEEFIIDLFDIDFNIFKCDLDIFVRRNDDDIVGLFVEDEEFFCIMD